MTYALSLAPLGTLGPIGSIWNVQGNPIRLFLVPRFLSERFE